MIHYINGNFHALITEQAGLIVPFEIRVFMVKQHLALYREGCIDSKIHEPADGKARFHLAVSTSGSGMKEVGQIGFHNSTA